jgi:RNA polymerase sigma factor (sigma-70 family)
MCDDPSVTDLVTRAINGEKQAWDALVERYAPLVWSICRRHGLNGADASDVGQSVWVQLASELDQLRHPAGLPSWLAATTVRECRRVRCAVQPASGAAPPASGAGPVLDAESLPDDPADVVEHELSIAERHAALREAFAQLPARSQQLIALLIEDPPMSYAQIGAKLGIPVERVEDARNRCLGQLRRYPAVAALISAEAGRPEVI